MLADSSLVYQNKKVNEKELSEKVTLLILMLSLLHEKSQPQELEACYDTREELDTSAM